jgi:hypothetical protein
MILPLVLKKSVWLALFCLFTSHIFAQNTVGEARQLPLKKISIFSSGVSYFEHRGSVDPNGELALNFNGNAVNDALKSLVINDPEASSPAITYQSETTLFRTLQSLKINLSGNPGIAEILSSLRGEEIQITTAASVVAPVSIDGRIVAVEIPPAFLRGGESAGEPVLTISTTNGLRLVKLKDIQSFTFKNAAINSDLARALDMIRSSNNSGIKTLSITLPGRSRRDVSLSYVIPSPVWKVSYRLDLNGAKPFLQGWAIIDNDGDIDWTDVEISLVTGRPVSFIQNLYPPYYVNRPTLPLAIAGAAEAQTYESGFAAAKAEFNVEPGMVSSADLVDGKWVLRDGSAAYAAEAEESLAAAPRLNRARASVAGGVLDTARGTDSGDQFEFTLKKPVTLARQQSAMLPLVEGPVTAEKTLVFSGQRALSGGVIHPAISAQLTNNTGMKLPAGPITVFDGGIYAGDALLEFLPEGEKRIISYGDDLSVSGSVTSSFKNVIAAVSVRKGLMTLSRKNINEKTYTIRNAGSTSKKLIIEHPITRGATLTAPPSFDEQTASLYRFTRNIAAGAALDFTVSEETPVSETITLSRLSDIAFASYMTNSEIPTKVRDAFAKALSLKRDADEAIKALNDAETRRVRLVADEERIRNNLEAVGVESAEGQEYLRRLAAQDAAIDAQNDAIDAARKTVGETEAAYEEFLNGLEL